jgi:hypothetical protein
MTHVEEVINGTAPKRVYHNKAWAALMKRVGLYPSTTGAPGGKETGQSCSHYIMEGGPFALKAAALIAQGFAISWGEMPRITTTKQGKRAKYVCPSCDLKAWAKHEASLMCGECGEEMECED